MHTSVVPTLGLENKNSLLASLCPLYVVGMTPEAVVSDVISLFSFLLPFSVLLGNQDMQLLSSLS